MKMTKCMTCGSWFEQWDFRHNVCESCEAEIDELDEREAKREKEKKEP